MEAPTLKDLIQSNFVEIRCIGLNNAQHRCGRGIKTKHSPTKAKANFGNVAKGGMQPAGVREKLEAIATSLLCRTKGHPEQAASIANAWILEAKRAGAGWASFTAPTEAIEIMFQVDRRQELPFEKGVWQSPKYMSIENIIPVESNKNQCAGVTAKGCSCRNPISKPNQIQARKLLDQLAKKGTPNYKQEFVNIARLLLCPRYHQGQAETKAAEWLEKLQDRDEERSDLIGKSKLSKRNVSVIYPTFSDRGQISAKGTPSSQFWSPHGGSWASTPATTPSTSRHASEEPALPPWYHKSIRGETQGQVDNVANRQREISASKHILLEMQQVRRGEQTALEFVAFKANQTTQQAWDYLLHNIRRNLSPCDESGYIYVFERFGSAGHVKIGRSLKAPLQRIESQARECGYRDRVQPVSDRLQRHIPNYKRAELLVHSLYGLRRKQEILCNRGQGCRKSTVHREWFEISQMEAIVAVEEVRLFMDLEPYGQNKELSPPWVKHLEKLELNEGIGWLNTFRAWVKAGPKKPKSIQRDPIITRSKTRADPRVVHEDIREPQHEVLGGPTPKPEIYVSQMKLRSAADNIMVGAELRISGILGFGLRSRVHTCIGYQKGSETRYCVKKIEPHNQGRSLQLIGHLIRDSTYNVIFRKVIEDLVSNMLCEEDHQAQAQDLSEKWLDLFSLHFRIGLKNFTTRRDYDYAIAAI
ncbi:MAG: hypothetical protein M1824_003625 [Vezdaea acicularis]|nr:MAG: hypothetical protein M1824_003625 [Vezdaea acicularis]